MSKRHGVDWGHLAQAMVAPFLAGAVGSAATFPALPEWYEGLAKPLLNPPNWVFGPVWTVLYVLMGFALYRVIRGGIRSDEQRVAVQFFGLQLVFNALWSVTFFGLRDPLAALGAIAVLLLLVTSTLFTFRSVDRLAAWLILPYLLWTLFATYLNVGIVALN